MADTEKTGAAVAGPLVVVLDGGAGWAASPHPASTPLLLADDLGALRGDGCFETLLLRGGTTRNVDRHLARFARSADALGIRAPSDEAWRHAIAVAEELWNERPRNERPRDEHPGDPGTPPDEAALRLVCTRGPERGGPPTAYVTVSRAPGRVAVQRAEGIRVTRLERCLPVDAGARAPWLLLGAKTLSYAVNMAALRHAEAEGFDDVVFVSAEGRILEGPRSTVVIVRGKTLVTPPASDGILEGTTVDALFALARAEGWACVREPLLPVDLLRADGVWLLGSVTVAAPVRELDGMELPTLGLAEGFLDLCLRSLGG